MADAWKDRVSKKTILEMVRESGCGDIVQWDNQTIKNIENPQDSPILDKLMGPAKDLAARIVLQRQGVLTEADVSVKSNQLMSVLTDHWYDNHMSHMGAATAVAKYSEMVEQQFCRDRQIA